MASSRSARAEASLTLAVLVAALLFLLSGAAYFISEIRAGAAKPTMTTGGGATCIYYGRDGLQCWPEFDDQPEAEPQGLVIERGAAPAGRLRI